MDGPSPVRRDAPAESTVPPFPSLFWPPRESAVVLHELDEMWKFTLFWTLILYGLFHLGAVGVAVLMHGGKKRSNWKYLWLVPLVYALIAGAEALIAGTLVGLMVGATYLVGGYTMSTWIPFVWGWVNVLVLIVSSFRIQGGL
ncbi:a53aa926-aee7-4a47-8d33-a69cb37cab20 [Thermothielavioides terrestris]|uniref:A53aa926-aee7-4a47-8d33-a69cb37cab20 n=1 Tax=Thermothielavioides terrestris TaxID=2587410 RepID=A0A446BII0_9PEZI|nr:a53aa926-aee7-4a47-8d33-a69cb37cab20 [Thermothielavioides terrestris]